LVQACLEPKIETLFKNQLKQKGWAHGSSGKHLSSKLEDLNSNPNTIIIIIAIINNNEKINHRLMFEKTIANLISDKEHVSHYIKNS
jgi:hypothetical protein